MLFIGEPCYKILIKEEKIIKKINSLVIIGLVLLCSIEVIALPLNQVDYSIDKPKQTPYEINTNTTNLTIIITGGVGGGFTIKNIGEFDAIQLHFHHNESYKRFIKNFTVEGSFLITSLQPGGSFKMYWSGHQSIWSPVFQECPLGFGPINIEVTARADNTLPVTETAKGIILFHFVIISKLKKPCQCFPSLF